MRQLFVFATTFLVAAASQAQMRSDVVRPVTVAPAPPVVNESASADPVIGEERDFKDVIGFDAKVKRDPNGNVIDDGPSAPVHPTEFQKMRRDSGTNLRSDRQRFNPAPATAPEAPVPSVAVQQFPSGNVVAVPLTPEQ